LEPEVFLADFFVADVRDGVAISLEVGLTKTRTQTVL
jgi:hypothetical protein